MVHGFIYSVQYEIYLTQPLDLFDQVLPLCSKVRKMIEYEEKDGVYKLVILNWKDLHKRFESNPSSKKYIDGMYDSKEEHYHYVANFSKFIKHNPTNPISDDEFAEHEFCDRISQNYVCLACL